jgi:hypothetical protein
MVPGAAPAAVVVKPVPATPFESIESAQEYLTLLAREVEAANAEIETDLREALLERAERRIDALHVVDYKLRQLLQQLVASRRILNDLRMLRRVLTTNPEPVVVSQRSAEDSAT